MEAAAMQEEKAMCLSDVERPKSHMEKWNEKQGLQHDSPSSSQMSECQAAVDIPTQEQMTSNEPLSLREASLQPSKNADSLHLSRISSLATENFLSQSMAFYPIEQDFLDKELPSSLLPVPSTSVVETNTEEEYVRICISDLLLACPLRKRPRLLPPNTKMHLEVPKKVASCLQHNNACSACSPIPLDYSHLPNTMSVTKPLNIPKVECTLCRFPPKLRKDSCRNDIPGYLLTVCLSRLKFINAPFSEQPVRKTDRMKPEQHQPSSPKRNAPSLDEVAAKQSLSTPLYNKHLPPKKRSTRLPPKKQYVHLKGIF